MRKCIYRNWYYVKESIFEFLQCNKKCFSFSLLAVVIGAILGLCIGINNTSHFTYINITDKTLIAIFSGGNFFSFFISNCFKYLFLIFLILVVNNFSFLRFLNYLVFGYLSFVLLVDCIIIISLFSLKGVLFCVLGYIIINLCLIAILITISAICKLSCDTNGGSSKFSCYPYKNIIIISFFAICLLIILSLIAKIFSNFIVIII